MSQRRVTMRERAANPARKMRIIHGGDDALFAAEEGTRYSFLLRQMLFV